MNDRFTPEGSVAVFWLVVFAISLFCAVWGAASLLLKRLFQHAWLRLSWCVAALLPTTLIVIDLFDRGPKYLDGVAVAVWKPSLLLLFLAVQFFLFSQARATLVNRASLRLSATGTIWILVVTAWSSHLFYSAIETRTNHDPTLARGVPPPVQEATELVAFTDKHRTVRLLTPLEGADLENEFQTPLEQFSEMLILQAPPTNKSNCHGWVFADGRFIVQGVDVNLILEDNGYELVDEPRENDVIVYRNAVGYALHTGLVRFVGENGLVLIESKWGGQGRYLHYPETQAYSQIYDFYRSPREGHTLRFELPTPPSEAPGSTLDVLVQRSPEKPRFSGSFPCKHVKYGSSPGFGYPWSAGSSHGFVWGRAHAGFWHGAGGKNQLNQPKAKATPLDESHKTKLELPSHSSPVLEM